jgi:hypothetical protein
MEEERTENPESSQSVSHIFFFSQTVPVPSCFHMTRSELALSLSIW